MAPTTTRERPILMSGEMVRAILDGRKTQTRRTAGLDRVNARADDWLPPSGPCETDGRFVFTAERGEAEQVRVLCPFGQPGDRLWVRETSYIAPVGFVERDSHCNNLTDPDGNPRCVGWAASMDADSVRCAREYGVKPTPSIHMPRWASRLTLEVTDVRVERLQDIGRSDVLAEGVTVPADGSAPLLRITGKHAPYEYMKPGTIERGTVRITDPEDFIRAHFASLWDALNDKRGYGWGTNPWVWVVGFKLAGGAA